MRENFKLIIITPEKTSSGEAEIITELFQAGLKILHMRKPDHTRQEVKNLLNGIPKYFHSGIVLHQHYELLNEFDLKGAHLPESFRREGNTTGIKNIISTSYHKLEDITRESANFEYAFLSPVFKSISKKGHESSFTPDKLRIFFQSNKLMLRFPIVALGGITESIILLAEEIGFGGAACIGYIWESPNPVEQLKKLQNAVQG
jgi:thiamine-phosphate pyrophosphorylase